MKQFKTVKEVYEAVKSGETVYFGNKSYKVYIEKDLIPDRTAQSPERQFASINNEIVSIRCISNYFGSIISESDLSKLFKK